MKRPSSSSSKVIAQISSAICAGGKRLVAVERVEQRLLEREDEGGGFARRKALQARASGTARRASPWRAHRPAFASVAAALGQRVAQQMQEIPGLRQQFAFR